MNLVEFQNITPIENIPSIIEHGILSYKRASVLRHCSVALQKVQDKREAKQVPNGLKLHEYANVYFHARNPMMSRRRNEAESLCVLRISTEILKLPGAVITDQNAASNYAKFSSPNRLGSLDLDSIFAENWKHPEDPRKEFRHSSAKCAEVLIPNLIPPKYLLGAYVVNKNAGEQLEAHGFPLPFEINADLFFH
jgi:hypothetical protein